MEVMKVGIFLEERSFAEAMARALAGECRKMSFCVLESPEAGGECDLILSSEKCSDENVILLVNHLDEACPADCPPYRIYKYTDSQTLIRKLLYIGFQLTGEILEHRGRAKTKMLVFASAAGGCGATSISLAAAKSLRQLYGSRCLYLNLCPINDSKKYLKMKESENLLKLLYYLSEGKDFPLEALITETEELDYFSTGLINAYADEMKPAVIHNFLGKLEQLGTYDFLLVDIGNHLCRANKKLLEYADRILLISRDDMKLPGKYTESVCGEIEGRPVSGRVIHIVNFAQPRWRENDSADIVYISDDRDAFSEREDGTFELLMTRNYGMEISAVSKRIMEEGDVTDG